MAAKIDAGVSRKDALFSVLAVTILLIGMATGSAMALLVMSLVGLALMAVCYRKQLSGGLLLPAAAAAIAAIGVGLVMSMR